MRRSRHLRALAALAVLLLTGPGISRAASIEFQPSHVDVVVGETFTLDVYMDFAGDPTLGGGFDLTEPSGLLGYLGFEFDAALGDDVALRRLPDLSPGRLSGFGFGNFDGLDGRRKVGTLTLTAVAPGDGNVGSAANETPVGPFVSAGSFDAQDVEFQAGSFRVFATAPDLPRPDIAANGVVTPTLTLPVGSDLDVAISLDPGQFAGQPADWWVWLETSLDPPWDRLWWSLFSGWQVVSEPTLALSAGLFELSPFPVLEIATLPPGHYRFHFAVDHDQDGAPDLTYEDSVAVTLFTPDGDWSVRSPMSVPRLEGGVALLDGLIYVVGGIVEATGASVNTVERYDPAHDTWTTLAPLPEALNHVSLAGVGGVLYAIGGFQAPLPFVPVDSVYAFDPATGQWSARAPLPAARGGLAVTVIDGLIYAVGGEPLSESQRLTVYDPVADAWSVLASMPTGRDSLAAVNFDGKLVAISGRIDGDLKPQTEIYDPATDTWSAAAPIPTPRGGHTAAVVQDRIYVFGGEGNSAIGGNGVFPVVEEYVPASDTWAPVTAMPDGGRHGFGAVTYKGRVWLPGGAPVIGFGKSARLDVYRPPVTAQGPFAYVTNFFDDTVTAIDTQHDIAVATTATGDAPRGVGVHPDGSTVYVTDAVTSALWELDTGTHAVRRSVTIGSGPNGASGVAVSPDGSRVYVANLGEGTVSFVDLGSFTVTDVVQVGAALRGLVVHPDGSRVYVAVSDDDALAIIDTVSKGVTLLPVGDLPIGVTVHPDGSTVYVSNNDDGTVSAIDAATSAIVGTVTVGTNARGLAVHPDGDRLYVSTFWDSTVVVVDLASFSVVASIDVGAGVIGVDVHPDGSRVYAAVTGSDEMVVIDTATRSVRERIPVGDEPISLGAFISGSP